MRSMSKLSLFLVAAALSLYLVSAAPAQWSRNAGNSDVYLTNLSDDVGIGLNNPARQLHVRGENAVFRLDRWVNSPGFIISRLQHGIAAPLKTFHVGVKAWGVDAGRFFIEDLHTAEGGDGDVRLAIDEIGNVGIGTTTPESKLTVVTNLNTSEVRICNGYTGTSSSDGLLVGVSSAATGYLRNKENGPLQFWTNDEMRMAIDETGDVGIGMYFPDYQLDIEDSSTTIITRIYNSDTGSNADCLQLRLGRTTPTAANNFITFVADGSGAIGAIEGNGTGGITLNTSSGDFAEYLPRLRVDESIGAGDIVGISGGKITRATLESEQVRVVSTAPIVLGNNPGEEREHLYEKVAFLGRAPVKVRGEVQLGDYIVPSGLNDGVGEAISPKDMTPAHHLQIVGRAWGSSDKKEVKLIDTSVGLHTSSRALSELSREKDRQIEELTTRVEALERILKD
jgi:hypothetical protein